MFGAQSFQLTGATSADQGMMLAKQNGGERGGGVGVGKKRIMVERRTAGYIDGGRRETGGARRQISIGASVRRQTCCGRAKPEVDGSDPQSGVGPTGAKPEGGGAETGGGPANRNSTLYYRF